MLSKMRFNSVPTNPIVPLLFQSTHSFRYMSVQPNTLLAICPVLTAGFLLQERINSDYWATPFEVHLAARRFNCIIHLFHSVDAVKTEHYCFKPEYEDRPPAPGSAAPKIIFLKSELKNGRHWHFQWCRVSHKFFREESLRSALKRWLGQDDIRPVTALLLGNSERDFASSCSMILKKAYDKNRLKPENEVMK